MGTVVITKRPIKTIYAGSPASAISSWVAGWVPINYQFLFQLPTDRIIIRVYEYASNTLLAVSTHAPRPDLTMNYDISEYVRSYLFSKLATINNEVNLKDPGNTLKVYFTYQVYDLNEDVDALSPRTLFSEEANYISVTCSAKQYGDLYGGNMGEYVPFGVDLDDQYKSKFLTAFEMPVKFIGFPFSLSFIYSEQIANHAINRDEVVLDVNGTQLTEIVTPLDPSQGGQVNYLMTSSYQSTAKYADVSLSIGEAIPQAYVDAGYVDPGYTEIL